jgi:CRP-like cAMP-binding protein
VNLFARLAQTLLRLTATDELSASCCKVRITQREISQIVGKSRESTNKQLRAWVKRGMGSARMGRCRVLKVDKLEEVASEDSEFDPS